jgi:hypothetical protein
MTIVNGKMNPEALEELRRLARSKPKSGRGQLAKLGALRTIERLSRSGVQILPACPPGWHPQAGSEWEELDRVYLDEHPEVRERMWRRYLAG